MNGQSQINGPPGSAFVGAASNRVMDVVSTGRSVDLSSDLCITGTHYLRILIQGIGLDI